MRKAVIRCLVAVLSRLPLRVGHWLGAAVGLALYYFPTRMRRVTDANLTACFPTSNRPWRARIARLSLMETGKSLIEAPYLWRASSKCITRLVKRISGQAIMDEALARRRGVVLAAPHLGSWELCGLYTATHHPITSLYRPPRLQNFEEILRAGREHTGACLVPTDARGIRALLRALKAGHCAGILPDQVPNPGNGVYAPFFGIDAYTMMLITRLAGKRETPVVFMFAQRLHGGRGYHVHYQRAPAEIYASNAAVAAAAVNRGVEELVRQCPEQYAWSYKRFKDRPPGQASIY